MTSDRTYDSRKNFVRPMLNTPVQNKTPEADLLVKRAITRLDASHEANKILTEWVFSQASVPRIELSLEDTFRLMLIWQSIQNRCHSGR
jgi:hypothetical protein